MTGSTATPLPGRRYAPSRSIGPPRATGARILAYSHDSFGLGHLRRSLLLCEQLVSLAEVSSALIATGSACAQWFPFPRGCDWVKLPSVTKTSSGTYRPRTLPLPIDDVVRIRGDLLRRLVRSWKPDLVLVDHAPVGLEGELWGAFGEAAERPDAPAFVLGLRDVIDEPTRVMDEWGRLDAWRALENVYDRILVYGDPVVGTTAQELRLDRRFGERLRFVGYVARQAPLAPDANGHDPTILVTVGGGDDGHEILHAFANFLERHDGEPRFRPIVVTGPLMSEHVRSGLTERYNALREPAEVRSFVPGLESLIASANGVVAMGGYNTLLEILSAGVPALVVPRRNPRREQTIRAEGFSALAEIEVCALHQLTPARIGAFVRRACGQRTRRPPPVRLDGRQRAAAEIRGLLEVRLAGRARGVVQQSF